MKRKIFVIMAMLFAFSLNNTSFADKETDVFEEIQSNHYRRYVTQTKEYNYWEKIPEYISYNDGIVAGKIPKIKEQPIGQHGQLIRVTFGGYLYCIGGTCPMMR